MEIENNKKQAEFAKRKVWLLQKKPYLSLYFRDFQEGSATQKAFAIQKARSAEPVLCYVDSTGKEKSLASRYEPGREARRLVPAGISSWQRSDIVLVLGLANPLVFEYILPYLKEGQICIAVDASLALGRLLVQSWPGFWDFLERPGCHLFCGKEGRELLERYLDGLPTEALSGAKEIRLRASEALEPEFYAEVSELLRATFKARMSDLMTRFRFEGLWLRNIVCNTRYLSHKEEEKQIPGPENLAAYQNALHGRPGVLVSAGPSLRFSLEHIRKLKKRAFVLACDTAARVLMEAGIFPHAVFSLDAQIHTLLHFLGLDFSQTILFSDIVAGPSLFRHISARGVIFSTTARNMESADGSRSLQKTPGTEFAEAIAGPLGFLQSGGSVATSAFDLLRFLGCSQILLVGQDLAYTWRQIHSQGVHHYRKWQAGMHRLKTLENTNESILQKRETFLGEGFYHFAKFSGIKSEGSKFSFDSEDKSKVLEGPIVCDYVLELYRHWLSDSSKNIEIPVYNLSLSGRKIDGAIHPDDLDAFIESLPEQEDLLGGLKKAPPLSKYPLPGINRLLSAIKKALASSDLLAAWENLLAGYPFLSSLIRRTEVYIKRNKERLDHSRIAKLRKERIREALESLHRGIARELENPPLSKNYGAP